MRFLKNGSSNPAQDSLSREEVTSDEAKQMTKLNLFYRKLKELSAAYKKYLLWIIPLFFTGFLVIFLLSLTYSNQQLARLLMQGNDQRTTLVRDQISDIRAQLDKLSTVAQNAPEAKALANLSDELQSVEKSMAIVAKSTELQKIATDIDDRFSHLENTVASNSQVKSYLDKKALPFQVISIDVMAEQPFVSVNYAHHTLPLGIGDSLAGWKVVHADYGAVDAEFVNDQGQTVKVSALENTPSQGDNP